MSSEDSDLTPITEGVEGAAETADDDGFLGKPSSRRTFLKAAALGTAAAAVWQKGPGLRFGPAAAYANDLSNYPCTANDVQVLGTGIVVNEPCICNGTFTATVAFQVKNNTGTGRYCITLHLVASSDGSVPAQDVILYTSPGGTNSTVPGGTTTTMYGQILSFPCNSGGTQICFGAAGSDGRGKCDPGTCSTVAWATTPNAAGCTSPDQSPPHGQCRHQRICVQGFGISAECADSSCTTRSLTNGCCSVGCGATLSVKITASGQSGATCTTPLAISVQRPGETTFSPVTLTGGCYVDPSPVAGTYTFRATDCHGCSREDTLLVCVQSASIAAPTLSVNPCSGLAQFSPGAVTGGVGPFTYAWSLDGGTAVSGATFTYHPTLDANTGGLDTSCHSLVVTVTDANGCTATSPATTFSQCVGTTTGCTP